MRISRTPKPIRCPYCGYAWFSKSRLKYVTCPNCHHKFMNPYYQPKSKT